MSSKISVPALEPEGPLYWSYSVSRMTSKGLEFQNSYLTLEDAGRLLRENGPGWLNAYLAEEKGKMDRWQAGLHETLQ